MATDRISQLGKVSTVSSDRLVRRRKHYIELLIYPGRNTYPIEHNRMDTPEKVLGWVYHLSKKGMVTTAHLRAFIEVAKELGVKVDFHA